MTDRQRDRRKYDRRQNRPVAAGAQASKCRRDAHGRVRGAMGVPSDEAPAETHGAELQRDETLHVQHASMEDYCPPGPNAGDRHVNGG